MICPIQITNPCDRPASCRFRHGAQLTNSPNQNLTVQSEVPNCTRGAGCLFRSQGRCYYFHEGVGVQMQRDRQLKRQSEESHDLKHQEYDLKNFFLHFFKTVFLEYRRLITRGKQRSSSRTMSCLKQ